MKRLNKRGFTLIELLAVLVILVVIMSIAIPSITSSVERSKAKQREKVIEIVKAQAELYFDAHANSTETTSVTVGALIAQNYLTKEEAKDPTNDAYTVCGYVEKNNTTFEFVEDKKDCVPMKD